MKTLRHALNRWVLLGRPAFVRLRAGDVIVLEVARPLSPTDEWELVRRVEDAFGYRNEVLVLTAGDRLTVVSSADGPGR